MNKENLIPISYVKQFTPLIVGDEIYNSESGSAFVIGNKGDQLKNLNANRNDNYRFNLVSFAARENTGKQPVGDDVEVDYTMLSGFTHSNCANRLRWELNTDYGDSDIETWKLNYDLLLAKFKEQGANTVKEPESMIGSSEYYQTGGEVVNTDLHTPAPVFTQEMADAVELPPIGCECELVYDGSYIDELQAGDRVLIGGYAKFSKNGGSVAVYMKIGTNITATGIASRFKPIDNRSDEDKLIDLLLEDYDISQGEAEALVTDTRFALTLNKE